MPKRDSGIGFDLMQATEGKPSISILYSSNTGTCESLANTLAKTAKVYSFNSLVEILNKATSTILND